MKIQIFLDGAITQLSRDKIIDQIQKHIDYTNFSMKEVNMETKMLFEVSIDNFTDSTRQIEAILQKIFGDHFEINRSIPHDCDIKFTVEIRM